MKEEDVFEKYKDLPKTRREAKAKGEQFYFTGKPCKHGHVTARQVGGKCSECALSSKREWDRNNKEHARRYRREYYQNNRDSVLEYSKKYYQNHKEEYIERSRLYRESNPDHYKEYSRNNRGKCNDRVAAYRASKLERTLIFSNTELAEFNDFAISEIYQQANDLKDMTGIPHDVDHIAPLRGESVSGLHVWYNLRPMPSKDNRSKNNKLVGDLLHEGDLRDD